MTAGRKTSRRSWSGTAPTKPAADRGKAPDQAGLGRLVAAEGAAVAGWPFASSNDPIVAGMSVRQPPATSAAASADVSNPDARPRLAAAAGIPNCADAARPVATYRAWP